jgi:signal transduction histidine kinase
MIRLRRPAYPPGRPGADAARPADWQAGLVMAQPAPVPGRARTLIADGALALLLLGIGIAGTAGIALHWAPAGATVTGWTYALVAIAALALAGRRSWPEATLAISTISVSAYLVLGFPYGPILLSLLVAVYTVARYRPMRRAVIVAAVALVVLLAHIAFSRGAGPGLLGIVPGSAWVVVPFAVGVTVRLNRESAARAQQEWARRHADEERLRVAQEVHDVVGHGLSAIRLQAEIALHLLPGRPEQAVTALSAISRTSREALDELRVTLALIRRDADARAPLPGLARLDALAARTTDSGVPVRVETVGETRTLPNAVDLAAYRVVQESLTNVLRHAGPATALVRLAFAPQELTVEVTDNGSGSTVVEPGQGIAGMRQRVGALGGSFTAGPKPGGGFRVLATIPAAPTAAGVAP